MLRPWPYNLGVASLKDSPVPDEILRQIKDRLVSALDPEQIYLFGSRAREEGGDDRDYDLLVVVKSSDLPGYKRDQEAYKALYGIPASKDVIVMTSDEFERRRPVVCSLAATVAREGRLIHQR
jgi:predicted nucleotidyltransferase